MTTQTPRERFEDDMRTSCNLLFLLVHGHALCITMLIRTSFGSNMPGLAGVVSLLLMVIVSGVNHDVYTYLLAEIWVVALFFQRLRAWYLACRRREEHSYYGGWPWFMFLFGMRDEMHAKRVEPMFCLFGGLLLMPLSETLGMFVMSASVSMFIVLLVQMTAIRRRMTAINDMRIEQRAMSERMRGRLNDY